MKLKPILFMAAIVCCRLTALAQGEFPKGRAVAAELQRFKDEGAVIVSSDTELVRLAKTYIDFGELYTPDEVNVNGFKGLFISEYTAMGMAHTDNHSTYDVITFGSDYYLVLSTEAMKAGERGRTLRTSQTSVGIPISNTLREKLPFFLIVFNNLLHLSHRADEDISVAPVEASMERVIGKKMLELKDLGLLIMSHELHKSIAGKPQKLAGVYPYPYAVSDLYEALRAVKERQPGKAVVFTSTSQSFFAIYIIRCDTYELLYGWSKRMYGRELVESDFLRIAQSIQKAE